MIDSAPHLDWRQSPSLGETAEVGICKGEYGVLPAAFHFTCKGCFHRSQMHRLQYAT